MASFSISMLCLLSVEIVVWAFEYVLMCAVLVASLLMYANFSDSLESFSILYNVWLPHWKTMEIALWELKPSTNQPNEQRKRIKANGGKHERTSKGTRANASHYKNERIQISWSWGNCVCWWLVSLVDCFFFVFASFWYFLFWYLLFGNRVDFRRVSVLCVSFCRSLLNFPSILFCSFAWFVFAVGTMWIQFSTQMKFQINKNVMRS